MSEIVSVGDSLRRYRSLRAMMMAMEAPDEEGEPVRVADAATVLFRREHEIVKSAIWFPTEMVDCGISAEHMEVLDYRHAWAVITKLVARGLVKPGQRLPHGPLLVQLAADYHGGDGYFSVVRGDAWLAALMAGKDSILSYSLNVLVPEWYARYRLRQQRRHYQQLVERIDQEVDPMPVQRDWQDEASRTLNEPDGSDVGMTMSALVSRHDENDKGRKHLVPLGLPKIDRANGGGAGRGDLCVVGGGTNHGKSYFAEMLLRSQSEMQKHSLYISVEDDEDLMVARVIADFSNQVTAEGASPAGIRSREATPAIVAQAKRRAVEALGDYAHYVSAHKATSGEICRLMRKARNLHKVDMVIVDYLQAVQANEPTNMKTNDVALIVTELKKCAKEIGVALVLMSQYSRDEYRDGNEPTINACKWAGEIENEAEIMILLWRDENDVLKCKVAKLKWSRSSMLRFRIDVDPHTGCLREWIDDFYEKDPNQKRGFRRPGRSGSDKAN